MKVPSCTLILYSILPVLALTQSQCDFGDESIYRPVDPGFNVYPDLSCTDKGLSFKLVHNYVQTRDSRIQLYYECKNWTGNVLSGGEVPNSRHFPIDDFIYSVPLTISSSIVTSSSCQVYGCYQENVVDSLHHYFPIQNRSCQYEAEATTTATAATTTTPSTTSSPAIDRQTTTTRPLLMVQNETEFNHAETLGSRINLLLLIAGILMTIAI